MSIDEMIAVLQAAKAGKQIQSRPVGSQLNWIDLYIKPSWNFSINDYRVKPEPREWEVYESDGRIWPVHIGVIKEKVFRVREVLE